MDGNAQVISQAEALLAELPAITRPVVARYFRQHFKIDLKSDNSPVTIADKLVEAEIRQAITSAFSFPDMACDIIGEEQGGEANSRYCWVIDPIDGTRAFVVGRPIFGTLVAFVDNGQAVAGLIDMPMLDEAYLGGADGAVLVSAGKTQQINSSNVTSIEQAHIATTSPDAFSPDGLKLFDRLSTQAAGRHYGGDCYNYALLGAGHLDIVMEHQLAPHDMMALVAVLNGAGATVTDWSGRPVTLDNDGSILAAATAELHQQALDIINS